jgi:hypothetical protein
MRALDKTFVVVAAVIQLGIAAGLLWAGNAAALDVVIMSEPTTQGSPEVARLISDYRQALGIAREIFADAGIALLCSFGLTVIVLYRSSIRRDTEKL